MNGNYVTIDVELGTKNFEKQIDQIEGELEEIDIMLSRPKEFELSTADIEKLNIKAEQLNNKLATLKKRQKDIDSTNFKNAIKGIDNMGNAVSKTITKVARWGLAIFGIRSAYMAVRSAMNTLTQYDDQMASNIEYIRYALANTLKPVIEALINLAYKFLVYTNYIAKAWFGVDLFANSSAKAFKKAKDGISGANKEAKKLSKQLAGFDEMNVLQENGSTAQGGGGGGTPLPSFDLSAPEDVPIPKWLEWIKDHGAEIASIIAGITAALVAIRLLGVKPLMSLGIGLAIAGITYAIINLIKFLKDPTFESFLNIFIGIGVAIIGVGIAIGSLPAIVIGACVLIVALIVKYYDKISGIFGKLVDYIENKVIGKVIEKFGFLGVMITQPISSALSMAKSLFDSFFGGIKTVVDGIVKIFKGDFTGGMKTVFKGLKSIMLAPINAFISGINAVIRGLNKIKIPNWVPEFGGKGINIPQIPKLAKGGIVNMPGSGVMVGSAIAGERGAEGVIPLTDSQQMALLGEAIGRYITINANIENVMNGRVISRELQKIQNSSDFATNR